MIDVDLFTYTETRIWDRVSNVSSLLRTKIKPISRPTVRMRAKSVSAIWNKPLVIISLLFRPSRRRRPIQLIECWFWKKKNVKLVFLFIFVNHCSRSTNKTQWTYNIQLYHHKVICSMLWKIFENVFLNSVWLWKSSTSIFGSFYRWYSHRMFLIDPQHRWKYGNKSTTSIERQILCRTQLIGSIFDMWLDLMNECHIISHLIDHFIERIKCVVLHIENNK